MQGPTDAEIRAILVQAMADVGADPAFVYAFRKTGVYPSAENRKQLPLASMKAFLDAVEEYEAAISGRKQ